MTKLQRFTGPVALTAVILSLVLSGANCKKNQPPQVPTIDGPPSGQPGEELTFTVKTTDPDDDIVSYLIVWGDTGSVEWTPEYPSGQSVTRSRAFSASGDYALKVKARDSHEAESDWSEPFPVHITTAPTPPPAKPGAPLGPDSTWTGAAYTCSVATTTSKGNIRYVMNWSDAIDTTNVSYPSGETAVVAHMWSTAGTYDVKVRAILDAEPDKGSGWSEAKAVKVILNNAPRVDSVWAPPVAVKDLETFFTVYGDDADGDSIRVIVNWPSGDTTTEFFPTPGSVRVSHVFTTVDSAAMVIFWTQDWNGTKSVPDTVLVKVGEEGGVMWYWWNAEWTALATSALVANDGEEEVVMGGSWHDFQFYSIRTSNGRDKNYATTKYPEYEFTGDPGLCAATGHVIVGSDEGELYALTLAGLTRAWQWPDKPSEESLTCIEWGAPAISGSNIYIGRDDDNLYKFTDAGSSVSPGPIYNLDNASVVDAPVVDASGNVFFGTDSGYLIKIDGNLSSPIWRKHLERIGEVYGPIIGNDGTIYCGTDSSRLYAIEPDSGKPKWTAPAALDGVGARPALGASALFVGSEYGTAYSINPATGAINWQKSLAVGSASFTTTPIVAANGYVYFQSDNDVLYCVNQTDGTLIWSCDCKAYLPSGRGGNSHRPRKLHFHYDPNPSICANGNIIVVGMDALYCVAGYELGPLDPAAAWPKWQKDLSNTGKK